MIVANYKKGKSFWASFSLITSIGLVIISVLISFKVGFDSRSAIFPALAILFFLVYVIKASISKRIVIYKGKFTLEKNGKVKEVFDLHELLSWREINSYNKYYGSYKNIRIMKPNKKSVSFGELDYDNLGEILNYMNRHCRNKKVQKWTDK